MPLQRDVSLAFIRTAVQFAAIKPKRQVFHPFIKHKLKKLVFCRGMNYFSLVCGLNFILKRRNNACLALYLQSLQVQQ